MTNKMKKLNPKKGGCLRRSVYAWKDAALNHAHQPSHVVPQLVVVSTTIDSRSHLSLKDHGSREVREALSQAQVPFTQLVANTTIDGRGRLSLTDHGS